MIIYIKIDGRDKPKMKILIQNRDFVGRPNMSGRITEQVQKTLLEPGEKGQTYPVSKTGHSDLTNRILQFWLDKPLIRNSDT
jgi:hypothetical protein